MLVLDINPNQLLFAKRPKLLLRWLDAALALANSHLMLHPNNAVAAVAAHSQGCSFLYPVPSEEGAAEAPILRQRDGQFEAFYRVESAIRREVTRILMEETGLTISYYKLKIEVPRLVLSLYLTATYFTLPLQIRKRPSTRTRCCPGRSAWRSPSSTGSVAPPRMTSAAQGAMPRSGTTLI